MFKPINIYIQSRIKNKSAFNAVDYHSSGKLKNRATKEHEIESLRVLVDVLREWNVPVWYFDGFFYGYLIPHIGKEFDLLKFKGKEILNIELKSRHVGEDQILEQLQRNKYYLSHLGNKTYFYTVITEDLTCYKFENYRLEKCHVSELVTKLEEFSEGYLSDISNLFRAVDFLVSPFNTPEKFIKGEYFLTGAQEYIKNKILGDIKKNDSSGFFSITGRPGTGKTLLLYDVAKKLSQRAKTLVIHCGNLDVEETLSSSIPNFNLCDFDSIEEAVNTLSHYKYVLVDESHRISTGHFEKICLDSKKYGLACVFSSDPMQILTTAEKKNGIVDKIKSLPLVGEYELSERIRMNKQLATFILSLRNLNRKPDIKTEYTSVSLAYGDTKEEALAIIEYFKKKGYVFINYSVNDEDFSCIEDSFDVRHVIGKEYGKVVMLLDSSFYYNEDGKLEGIPYPDLDYMRPNLFYQGITRVREKLALVVLNAPELFEKISSIL